MEYCHVSVYSYILPELGPPTKYKQILANILRPAVMERERISNEGF